MATAAGRGPLLQGVSAGLIGVVVPLYLAECLTAANRGKGTGVFQWLLTFGIFAAAGIGYYFSIRVDAMERLNDPAQLLAFKDTAWRSIFWYRSHPGCYSSSAASWSRNHRAGFSSADQGGGADRLAPVPQRWASRHRDERDGGDGRRGKGQGAAHRRTIQGIVVTTEIRPPFVLACIILACNQATGINSIIGYNATILIQAGLSDKAAHLGYVIFTLVNFLTTMGAVALVDRKGRKFLLSLGSAGIIASLIAVGALFAPRRASGSICQAAIQAMVTPDQNSPRPSTKRAPIGLLASTGEAGKGLIGRPTTMVIIYSCGDFRGASQVVRSADLAAKPIELTRESCLPANKVVRFSPTRSPISKGRARRRSKSKNALITPVPSENHGWLTAISIYCFIAFFAIGPGVCVWLALSELMPTRIRSNGMSIALLINQAVSTTIAAVFLPTVGKYGYATMFFAFAGCTVVYFVTAAFFLPETKGRTLEEIEEHFAKKA